MARQRPPLPVSLPFEYVVLGQPRSTQNRTAAYTAWRDKAIVSVVEELDARNPGRTMLPSGAKVRLLVVWLSAQPDALDHPDTSNIVKPLEDALVSRVIDDDAQVRRIEIARIDLNRNGLELPDSILALADHPDYAKGEIVYVLLDVLDAPDTAALEWWK